MTKNNTKKTYFDPAATVTAVMTRMSGGKVQVLLTRRAIEPFKDMWCLPGGHIDRCERSDEAIVREVREETGLAFKGERFGSFDEIFEYLGIHNVVIAYAGSGTGKLAAQKSEVSHIKWVLLDEARGMPLAFEHRKVLDEFVRCCVKNRNDAKEGLLEEFRALRGEMTSIFNARLWGTATYLVLVLGIISSLKGNPRPFHWLFLLYASIPFILHTAYRERARIRAGVYIKEKIEPYVKGLDWENFVDRWRYSPGSATEENPDKGKPILDRILHIMGIGGLYTLVISASTVKCVISAIQGHLPYGIPKWVLLTFTGIGLLLSGAALWNFFTLYAKIEKKSHDVCAEFNRKPPLC